VSVSVCVCLDITAGYVVQIVAAAHKDLQFYMHRLTNEFSS